MKDDYSEARLQKHTITETHSRASLQNKNKIQFVIPFQNSSIHFTDYGCGVPVVLLHGYLETHAIWNDFAMELSKQYRVIAIDIPGHGKSGVVADIHTMELMADAVIAVTEHLAVERFFLVGHSMGGYISLAILEQYKPKIMGVCLFHSHPFADSEEKKILRNREIAFIQKNRTDFLVVLAVGMSYAKENISRFQNEIENSKAEALKCPKEGIIALIEGMKIRTDKQELLISTSTPILYILGRKDEVVPLNETIAIAQQNKKSETVILENSAHIGFIEEKEISLNVLISFIPKKCS